MIPLAGLPPASGGTGSSPAGRGRRSVLGGLLGLLGLLGLTGPVVQAQQTPPAPPVQSAAADAALTAQLRTVIASDTTAFTVGHTDFRRYATPGYCLVAVRHAITLSRRTIAAQEALDTVRRAAASDTLPAYTRAVARGCAARFPAAATPVPELPHLFQLAVLAQQDTLAEAVLARQLALSKTPRAKAELLVDAVGTYVQAEPAQVVAAEAVLARMDALGSDAALMSSRLAVHQRLLAYGDSTRDEARVRREAATLLRLARTLPPTVSDGGGSWAAYQALGRLAYAAGPDSLAALARQLQQDALHVPTLKRYAALPVDSVVRQLSPVGDIPGVGQPTPVLHADVWFPAPGQASDTLLPHPGRVSLFIGLPAVCYAYTGGSFHTPLDPIASGCQRVYNMIRRWRVQSGTKVDITVVAPVTSTIALLLTGPESATEAVKRLQWYVFDYLKLPVNRLAVQTLPMQAPLPAPDGRLFVQPATAQSARSRLKSWSIGLDDRTLVPFERVYAAGAYRQTLDPAIVLTGPDGRCLYSGGPSAVFDAVFARALAAPAQPAPTASPAPAPAAATSPRGLVQAPSSLPARSQ